MNIKVEQHYRDHWLAWDNNTYDGPGSALGHGATREEAIIDLVEKLDEELEPRLYRNNWRVGTCFPYPKPVTDMSGRWVEIEGVIYV